MRLGGRMYCLDCDESSEIHTIDELNPIDEFLESTILQYVMRLYAGIVQLCY
jgi:hypothetical protein